MRRDGREIRPVYELVRRVPDPDIPDATPTLNYPYDRLDSARESYAAEESGNHWQAHAGRPDR